MYPPYKFPEIVRIPVPKGITSADKSKLVAMVQSHDSDADTDMDAELGAPAAATYESHSGGWSIYAKKLILVRNFRVNLKILTLNFWFSLGLISNILV